MKIRKESNAALLRALSSLEGLGREEDGAALARLMQDTLGVFEGLANRGYTEDQLDHIINYCRSRVEYVLYLLEREEWEDALQLAKQTLRYYLKNSALEAGAGVES